MLKKEQSNGNSFLWDLVINSIDEFKYSPEEEDVIFVVYFCCYEKVLQKDCMT